MKKSSHSRRNNFLNLVVLALLIVGWVFFGEYIRLLLPDNTEIDWKREKNQVVLVVQSCCQAEELIMERNYLNDVTVYGDGTMVWVPEQENPRRRVLVGRITQYQLQELLEDWKNKHFFQLQDRYKNPANPQEKETCVQVNLLELSKQVCAQYSQAPKQFEEFQAGMRNMLVVGEDFLPQTGYLQMFLREKEAEDENGQGAIAWNTEFDFDRRAYTKGIWIDGALLEFVWEVVNSHWQRPSIKYNEEIYEVTVRVEDVSKGLRFF